MLSVQRTRRPWEARENKGRRVKGESTPHDVGSSQGRVKSSEGTHHDVEERHLGRLELDAVLVLDGFLVWELSTRRLDHGTSSAPEGSITGRAQHLGGYSRLVGATQSIPSA
jgi:hypothetical protein